MAIDRRYLDPKFEGYASEIFGRHVEPEMFDVFLRELGKRLARKGFVSARGGILQISRQDKRLRPA
jgi:hypothetical protein